MKKACIRCAVGLLIGLCGVAAARAAEASDPQWFYRDTILRLMLWVNDGQRARPDADRNGEHGAWYAGVVAVGKATGDDRFKQQLSGWDKPREGGQDSKSVKTGNLFEIKTEADIPALMKSRGKAWVYAGLARALDPSQPTSSYRARYSELFKQISEQLINQQGADGLWRPAQANAEEELPMPERLGTAYFCYGMALGVNRGLLDRQTMLPVLRKAWIGLAKTAGTDGGSCGEQNPEENTGAFLLAASEMYRLADAFVPKAAGPAVPPVVLLSKPFQVSDKFPRLKAPGTGRVAVQLTSGPATCYPMYYFAPTLTGDCKYMIYHRHEKGTLQLWRLNLQTAETVPLTHSEAADAEWTQWQPEKGLRGIGDYRSAINQVRGTVVYFEGTKAREVNIETLQDQPLFELAAGREMQSQNCVSPDGKWFVYIDRPVGSAYGKPCQGALMVAYNFETKERRTLCSVDHGMHHVTVYDNEHFIAHHPPGHMGLVFADLTSGKWTDLRYGDPGALGMPCHSVPSALGVVCEVLCASPRMLSGLYDPLTRSRFEFALPADWGYTHTGWDPSGRLWVWETIISDMSTGKRVPRHCLWYMERFDPAQGGAFKPLTGDWPTYSGCQRGHMHPQVTPDRRWVLFTGGDAATKKDQIFLLDISDLKDTQGVTLDLLSHAGANDRKK
jgi:hypothetical protein